jgi:hypothetical protein
LRYSVPTHLAHLVVPHLWAAADITAARSRRPRTQVPLRPVFPPRAHPDYLLHSTVVSVPAAIPLPTRAIRLPPGAGAATASAACVQAVLLSAGFLRVLVTHYLLCEKRRVDLFQVKEQRSSQPLWPSTSCFFVRSVEPHPLAVLQVQLNCRAGGSSSINL